MKVDKFEVVEIKVNSGLEYSTIKYLLKAIAMEGLMGDFEFSSQFQVANNNIIRITSDGDVKVIENSVKDKKIQFRIDDIDEIIGDFNNLRILVKLKNKNEDKVAFRK